MSKKCNGRPPAAGKGDARLRQVKGMPAYALRASAGKRDETAFGS